MFHAGFLYQTWPYTNFTMQSIQIGFAVMLSTNTLAGCSAISQFAGLPSQPSTWRLAERIKGLIPDLFGEYILHPVELLLQCSCPVFDCGSFEVQKQSVSNAF